MINIHKISLNEEVLRKDERMLRKDMKKTLDLDVSDVKKGLWQKKDYSFYLACDSRILLYAARAVRAAGVVGV